MLGLASSCSALPQLSEEPQAGLQHRKLKTSFPWPIFDTRVGATILPIGILDSYLPQQPHPITLRSLQRWLFYTAKTEQERTNYYLNMISRKSQTTLRLSEGPGRCPSCRFELTLLFLGATKRNESKLSNIIRTLF